MKLRYLLSVLILGFSGAIATADVRSSEPAVGITSGSEGSVEEIANGFLKALLKNHKLILTLDYAKNSDVSDIKRASFEVTLTNEPGLKGKRDPNNYKDYPNFVKNENTRFYFDEGQTPFFYRIKMRQIDRSGEDKSPLLKESDKSEVVSAEFGLISVAEINTKNGTYMHGKAISIIRQKIAEPIARYLKENKRTDFMLVAFSLEQSLPIFANTNPNRLNPNLAVGVGLEGGTYLQSDLQTEANINLGEIKGSGNWSMHLGRNISKHYSGEFGIDADAIEGNSKNTVDFDSKLYQNYLSLQNDDSGLVFTIYKKKLSAHSSAVVSEGIPSVTGSDREVGVSVQFMY